MPIVVGLRTWLGLVLVSGLCVVGLVGIDSGRWARGRCSALLLGREDLCRLRTDLVENLSGMFIDRKIYLLWLGMPGEPRQ